MKLVLLRLYQPSLADAWPDLSRYQLYVKGTEQRESRRKGLDRVVLHFT